MRTFLFQKPNPFEGPSRRRSFAATPSERGLAALPPSPGGNLQRDLGFFQEYRLELASTAWPALPTASSAKGRVRDRMAELAGGRAGYGRCANAGFSDEMYRARFTHGGKNGHLHITQRKLKSAKM